jgi:hypothetical protein
MSNAEISSRRAFGRSWRDFPSPTRAEKILAELACKGEECWLTCETPTKPTPDNAIRAQFLRFLVLGGDEAKPVHEKGVRLRGAFVDGPLNLVGGTLPFPLFLLNCCFTAPIDLYCARSRTISLIGSRLLALTANRLQLDGDLDLSESRIAGETRLSGTRIEGSLECSGAQLQGLNCDRAKIGDSVFLAHDFRAERDVRFVGAEIEGDLCCHGGHFEGLDCDRADIGCSVSLANGFRAKGEAVRFVGARIRGDLCCDAGEFVALHCDRAEIGGSVFLRAKFHATGEVRFVGARIKGSLECGGGHFASKTSCALDLAGATIDNTLSFRNGARAAGAISFAQAEVGTLADDLVLWPRNALDLDGFRYQRIVGTYDARSRVTWLRNQQAQFLEGENFALQPWTHLGKVLREHGQFREAADVAIAGEAQLRRAGRVRNPIAHFLFGFLAGYGYKPGRIIGLAMIAWLGFGLFYRYVDSAAVFRPTNPAVLQADSYEHCRPDAPATPTNGKARIGNWTKCPALQERYVGFSPWAYSFDLILPIVNLSQAKEWTPVTSGDEWSLGYVTRAVTWVEQIIGWVAALTLAAIVSGLVKRKDRG